MPSSRMKNKVLQMLYRPGKAKTPGITLKSVEEMEKALETAVSGLKPKKKSDEKSEGKSD